VGLTGCGGDDQGRLVGDSNVVPKDSLANCDLAKTVDETLMLDGDFEDSSATAWKFETDTSTAAGGADLICPQDSRKPCSVTEADETQMIDASGAAPYTGVYDAYGVNIPTAPPKACVTGTHGLHVRAQGLYDWGGKLVRKYSDDKPLAYFDASGFDGISFWARTYSEKVGLTLFVSFDDKYTREDAYKTVVDGVSKSYCFDSKVDSEKCDRFGVGIGLETSWRYYKIPFSAFQQRGYGVKSDHLHTEELLGFGMGYDIGDWDFWVDRVAFYKEKS
jgi:hypothetical protein